MAANGNGFGNMNGNGRLHRLTVRVNNNPPPPRESFVGAERVAAFKRCHPPTYDGSTLGVPAQDWLSEIRSILEAAKIRGTTWVALVVMQLRGEAGLWWSASGYDPWHTSWAEFTTSFLPRFAPMEIIRETLSSSNQATSQYDQYSRVIRSWGVNEGESMEDYVRRFEQNIVQASPYPMEERYKCTLFWRGVPMSIRSYAAFHSNDYYHLRSEVAYAELEMIRHKDRQQRMLTRRDGASTSGTHHEEDPEEDPEEDSEEDPEEGSE